MAEEGFRVEELEINVIAEDRQTFVSASVELNL